MMIKVHFIILVIFLSCHTVNKNEFVNPANYLKHIKLELDKTWLDTRTINLVFHGHSDPAGYFKIPAVNT